MKIDCDVLGSSDSEFNRSGLFTSNREILTLVKIVRLGDQEHILRCLSSYDVVCSTSFINEANK